VQVGNAVCKVFLFDGPEADREIAALTLLKESEIPVPSILDAGVFPEGERWVLMTTMGGSPVPLAVGAWETPLGFAFQHLRGRVAGLLHSVVWPPSFGLWTTEPKSSLTDFAADASKQLERRAIKARPHRRPLIQALRHLQAELLDDLRSVNHPVVVHGDLGPGNILVDPLAEQMVMVGLIDWERAVAFDPAAELASVLLFGFDTDGAQAFCRGYGETGRPQEVVGERISYFLIDAVLEVFGTTGRRWSSWLDGQAQETAGLLLNGRSPVILGSGRPNRGVYRALQIALLGQKPR
jgi:aminoglycoside phosphotransferase (APT) family kinase protein